MGHGWHRRAPPILLAVSMLSACAAPDVGRSPSPPPGQTDPAPVEDRTDVHALLRRLALLAERPPSTLTPAFLDASSRVENRGDAASTLELAWLLAQPGTDFQDRVRAEALLDELLRHPALDTRDASLATLMRAELRQQNRRISALATAREQLASAQDDRQALEVQVATLTRLLETLQQQFEELKAIERDVN